MRHLLEDLQSEFQNSGAEQVLSAILQRFKGRVALASSLGAEDQVLTDMFLKIDPAARIFTLDTGRLHQETYEVMTQTMKKYNMRYEVYCPQTDALEELLREQNPNAFYEGLDQRKRCCQIRKMEPLSRAIRGLDLWVTGLRREQSVTRSKIQMIEWDGAHGLIKLNPLVDWSTEQVWKYIRDNDIPHNALHNKGYPSIGCAPCTRAVKAGEDIRMGRWWWEEPEHKECGLHYQDGKLVRRGTT